VSDDVDETAIETTAETPGPAPVPVPDLPVPDTDDDEQQLDDEPGDQAHAQPDHMTAFVRDLPAGYALCPTCLALGAVLEDPPFDPTTKTCPTCLGHGRTRTGAIAGNEVERPCTVCNQRGWVNRDASEPPASPARASDFAAGVTPRDVAGRTPDDPDFDWTSIVRDVEPVPLDTATV
jgi:hypothetical protein